MGIANTVPNRRYCQFDGIIKFKMVFLSVLCIYVKITAHLVIVHMRKYKINEDFFSIIDSEEKAYFLGFIFADGYVNEKNNVVDITIHNKDKEILNNLVSLLYPDGRPLAVIRKDYIRLVINSKKLVGDLKTHGCMQAKTFKLEFPEINEIYLRDFIRGYFDGDGCVYISKNNALNISIIGTIKMLDEIMKIFTLNCQVNETKYDDRHPNKKNNIRALRFGGNILVNRIYHYLYDDASVYLIRKRKIFLSILKNKEYFCDNMKVRKRIKHSIYYNGEYHNQSQLAKILSIETNQKQTTVRRKLQRGDSIMKIKNK